MVHPTQLGYLGTEIGKLAETSIILKSLPAVIRDWADISLTI